MSTTDRGRHPWVARSATIVAIVWVAGYFLAGTISGATTIAGILVLVGLVGVLIA